MHWTCKLCDVWCMQTKAESALSSYNCGDLSITLQRINADKISQGKKFRYNLWNSGLEEFRWIYWYLGQKCSQWLFVFSVLMNLRLRISSHPCNISVDSDGWMFIPVHVFTTYSTTDCTSIANHSLVSGCVCKSLNRHRQNDIDWEFSVKSSALLLVSMSKALVWALHSLSDRLWQC